MKKIKYIICTVLLSFTFNGCDDFLKEEPLDFYTPENSMVTVEQFQTSLNYLYNRARYLLCHIAADTRYAFYYATDFAFNATDYYTPAKLNDYANTMIPTFNVPLDIWSGYYTIITNANVILNRIEQTDQVSDENKALIRGEAKFFRAYAYGRLAHLFGGVPLELEEVEVPRRDYTRASREEVYNQVKQDLEDAVASLPNIESVEDGKVNKQIAQHLLAETDICLGLYDEAIAVATEVIDYPEVSLMTDRFGSRSTEEGDVYWDLFRLDNQNRSSGNKEGLWVIQYDYQNAGSSSNYDMSWALDPYYQTVMITAKDASGNDVMTTAFAGITDGKCGWGCGWMQPTEHFFTTIWEKGSENDIRNSKYNIIRDVLIDNPESPACGKWFVADGYSQQVDPIRQWYPMITKFSRVNNYPEDLYIRDSNGNPQMTVFGEHLMISSQGSYKDEYFFRLAETYLLRAEAYLMNGDKAGATADINVIRSRAHAEPATVDEVDIDYLLDERLRELYGEETRMVTLCRMGKLVERNRKYNPITGKTIEDHHNLWPIPFSEIERNTDATIEQNPGY